MLAGLIEAGKLKPVIEQTYKLSDAAEALAQSRSRTRARKNPHYCGTGQQNFGARLVKPMKIKRIFKWGFLAFDCLGCWLFIAYWMSTTIAKRLQGPGQPIKAIVY